MPNSAGIGLPHERSYSVSDGTVTDAVTGLVWQQTVPAQRRSWSAAKDVCQALVLGGRDDWRLPSRIELVSLIEHRRSDPSLDLTAFPFTPGAGLASDWFWTSTPAAGAPEKAWYVYFYFGYPDIDEQSSEFAVRCVRGGPAAVQQPAYEIAAETVRDRRHRARLAARDLHGRPRLCRRGPPLRRAGCWRAAATGACRR